MKIYVIAELEGGREVMVIEADAYSNDGGLTEFFLKSGTGENWRWETLMTVRLSDGWCLREKAGGPKE